MSILPQGIAKITNWQLVKTQFSLSFSLFFQLDQLYNYCSDYNETGTTVCGMYINFMTLCLLSFFMYDNPIFILKTAILSWLQNDGTRGFSKDQLKGKQDREDNLKNVS